MDVKEACGVVDLPTPEGFENLDEITRMSTFRIGRLINWIVSQMPEGQQYVNVGVWHGFSLVAGMFGNAGKPCIGVDNFSMFQAPKNSFREHFRKYGSEKHGFFEMGFEEYFKEYHQGEIGFYFYDGDHSYQGQFEGLKASETFLADGALIMVDDTNQQYPKQATLDFMDRSENEYEVVLDQTTDQPYDPIWWNGIMLIKKVGRKTDAVKKGEG